MTRKGDSFDSDLERRLDELRASDLQRSLKTVESPQGVEIVVAGRNLVNFSSNDYLGLAAHPRLREAAHRAVDAFGSGAGASRLICGSLTPLHELETTLARFKGCAAALVFSSGYATALGTISGLVGRGDFVLIDRLVHASIVDAARLSGASLKVFRHNDTSQLDQVLKRIRSRHASPRVLVVCESVYSMDGDLAPLSDFVELKDRHGAWLMVDEAHATGLFGTRRSGLVEHRECGHRVDVQMGTLGKAVGSAGGFVVGSRNLIELLIHRARSLVFSTAPVPAAAAAAKAGIDLIQSSEGERRCADLWHWVREASDRIRRSGFHQPAPNGPILPLRVGAERLALEVSSRLMDLGIFVPAIRYPTVARGSARLRITLSANHRPEHLDRLEQALREARAVLPVEERGGER